MFKINDTQADDITLEELTTTIQELPKKKAPGHDNITNERKYLQTVSHDVVAIPCFACVVPLARTLTLRLASVPQSHTLQACVLWFPGKGPIAGSPQAIARLVELGKTVFLLTNNSMASIDRYHGVCQKLGMPVPKSALVSFLRTCTGRATQPLYCLDRSTVHVL
uniref:Uncharacterized protein n=1 Tax=Timema genevievae TaxID=629358 RepID=A0A7R9JUN4_TIMGE|nr:unnamed protein product [Timema genevievae]